VARAEFNQLEFLPEGLMNYIAWAILGMAGYSLVTLFVKLATRSNQFSSFLVLAIATVIVCTSALSIAALRGDARALGIRDFASSSALWAYATGLALTVAVVSLFRALSLGPASVVVPIYGMFIVGGAILGIVFLNEPPNLRKVLGIGLAAVSIFLIATSARGALSVIWRAAVWTSGVSRGLQSASSHTRADR
jgi:transporter family protein